MQFIILVDPSLVLISTQHLFCLNLPQSKEENYLHVENTSILHYLSQNYLSLEWGVMKFPYLTDATHQFG